MNKIEAKILTKEPLGLSSLAGEIKAIENPIPIQQKVKDFAIKFHKLNKTNEAKVIKEITELDIPRLSKERIAEITNIMPKDVNELHIIFAGSKTTITQENTDKIMSVLKHYEK